MSKKRKPLKYAGSKKTRKQRGLYGYAPRDLWSLDLYLLSWLPDALRDLAKAPGYPGECESQEEWSTILHGIADDLTLGEYDTHDAEKCKRVMRGLKKLRKWFFALWW